MDDLPPSQPPASAAMPPASAAPAGPPTDPTAAAKPAKVPKPKKEETWWGTIRFLLYLFIGAILIRTFIFAPFSIPSGSMMPNLLVGDYLFVSKWSYGYSRFSLPFHPINFQGRMLSGVPERGDVIVFRHPTLGEDYVKRVIGVPGDTVAVHAGVVHLNGQAIARERIEPFDLPVSPNSPCPETRDNIADYAVRRASGADGQQHCLYPRFRETLPGGRSYDVLDQGVTTGDNFGPVPVPEGHLFVMGDNRDDSMDSRFPPDPIYKGVGLLPIDHVLGRALIGFWSTDGSSQWLLPWTWFTAARWSRIFETY